MNQVLEYADIWIRVPGCLGYILAADRFCRKYLGAFRKREFFFVLCSFLGWLSLNTAGRWYPAASLFLIVLNRILFTGLILLFFESDREKKILASSMLMACAALAENFCISLLSCLLLFFRHHVSRISQPVLSGQEILLMEYASLAARILAVCWLSGHLLPVCYERMGRWHRMMAVPLFVMTAVLDAAGFGAENGIMVRSAGNMGLYYDQMFSHAEFLVLTALFIPAAWFDLNEMNRIYIEQKKSSEYHAQAVFYKMLKEQYSQSERLRHDMKNHLIALSGLSKSREWDRLDAYLKKLEGSSQEVFADMTGNKAVDALVCQKRKRAQELDAAWECDVHIAKDCRIEEFDLCVLFGNLLDNALEACERMKDAGAGDKVHRFVSVRAGMIRKCFLLEVKNSMEKTENREISKKPEKKVRMDRTGSIEHGIGLLNVTDAVQKYNGTMEIQSENGIFEISILIPLI